MADQSDVEAALAGIVEGALYPGGLSAPSVLGRVVRVYRGWPIGAALERDLAAGAVNVTVFPDAHRQANTTRWTDSWTKVEARVPGLTLTVAGTTVTIAGSAEPGQVAGLLADGVAVVHRTEAGDTPQAVAAVLGAYLREHRPVTVAGTMLVVPGAATLVGRVVADQLAQRETRRQRQVFRVTCWCPDPETRDLAGAAVDAALSSQAFIGLPDGTMGQIRFVSSVLLDQSQNAALYRRDLLFSVEYATTVAESLPAMIFGKAAFAPGGTDTVHSLLG